MAFRVKVRNSKALTDLELEQIINEEVDDFDETIFDSDEDSDAEPEVIENDDDVITFEANEESRTSNTPDGNAEAALLQSEEGIEGYAFYKTKNNTNWNKMPFRQIRRRTENIIRRKQGLNQYSCNISSELDAFSLFLTDSILDIIVLHTNNRAQQIFQFWNKSNPNKVQRIWKPTDAVEIRAYIGLVFILGALQASKEPAIMLWCSRKGYGRPIIAATMSRTRFQFITSFFRFDDPTTRDVRKENDKLAAVREVFDKFIENFKKMYNPGSHITVDEQLVSFRGRCSFRVYMKSKPDKYGIKIWAAADSENAYTINMQPYLGKINNVSEKNQGERVVLDLVGEIGSGYGVTTDNFFTSLPLADKLLEKRMTLCGTLRKNKSYIPQEFLPKPYKPIFSSMFGFTQRHTMVSYVPNKGKAVILLSTEHHDDAVSGEINKFKPDIILHYNQTKGAVDTTDKMVKQYSARRITNRWPMAIFGQLLDVSGLNAFILWTIKFPEKKSKSKDSRRKFLLDLGEALIKENMVRRYRTEKSMNKNIRKFILEFLPELAEDIEADANKPVPPTPGRCYLCERKKDRKCRQVCSDCENFACAIHSTKKTICVKCEEKRSIEK